MKKVNTMREVPQGSPSVPVIFGEKYHIFYGVQKPEYSKYGKLIIKGNQNSPLLFDLSWSEANDHLTVQLDVPIKLPVSISDKGKLHAVILIRKVQPLDPESGSTLVLCVNEVLGD